MTIPSSEEKDSLFSQCYLLEGLGQDELEAIERTMVVKRYRGNTVIIDQGDEANKLYFLREGRVQVFVADENGREVVLGELGPGAVIGELALLAEIPRTASVATLEPCTCLVLTRHSFLQLVEAHPKVALNLARALARQVNELTEAVGDFALLDVYGRVAKLLRATATEQEGSLITPKLTHQQIADRVGASREMVSKILKELRAGGYIEVEGKRYILQRRLPERW